MSLEIAIGEALMGFGIGMSIGAHIDRKDQAQLDWLNYHNRNANRVVTGVDKPLSLIKERMVSKTIISSAVAGIVSVAPSMYCHLPRVEGAMYAASTAVATLLGIQAGKGISGLLRRRIPEGLHRALEDFAVAFRDRRDSRNIEAKIESIAANSSRRQNSPAPLEYAETGVSDVVDTNVRYSGVKECFDSTSRDTVLYRIAVINRENKRHAHALVPFLTTLYVYHLQPIYELLTDQDTEIKPELVKRTPVAEISFYYNPRKDYEDANATLWDATAYYGGNAILIAVSPTDANRWGLSRSLEEAAEKYCKEYNDVVARG